jgi:hypothetical protein
MPSRLMRLPPEHSPPEIVIQVAEVYAQSFLSDIKHSSFKPRGSRSGRQADIQGSSCPREGRLTTRWSGRSLSAV